MKTRMTMAFVALAAGLFAAPAASPAQAGGAIEENVSADMTQGQFAKMLVQKLGMHRHLSLNPSDLECVALLMQLGIAPSATLEEGWNVEATLTVMDVVRALVRTLGLMDQVEDPANDADWVRALERARVSTETVIDGVRAVHSVRTVLLSFLEKGMTQDPLYKNPVSASDVEKALDAINLPASVLPRDALRPIRPPRPAPVTPILETGY